MTREQEFDIMKLVLDKFLWLGFAIMAFGFYKWIEESLTSGFYYVAFGVAVLIIFVVILVREYEFITTK